MATIKRRLLIFLSSLLVLLVLMFSTLTYAHCKRQGCIVIGAKDITGQILAEIIAQLVESKTSFRIERKYHLANTFICFNAINAKDIDLYIEYTGTALTTIFKKSPLEIPSKEVLSYLRKEFKKRFDLILMDPLGFQSAYVFTVHPDFAREKGLETLSDLAELMCQEEKVKVAFDPEFYARPEGTILEEKYGMQFSGLKFLDHELLYLALQSRSVDVINGYATDGFILAQGLKVLKDDRKEFPPYEAAIVVRNGALKSYPELRDILGVLSERVSLDKMREMNYAMEKKGENVHDVAQQFLIKEGLLSFILDKVP